MTIGSMRIGSRLAVSFSILLGLMFAVAAVSLSRLEDLAKVTQTIVHVQAKRVFLAYEANSHAQVAANCLLKLLQTTARERRIVLYAEMDAELAASDEAVANLGNTLLSTEDRSQLERLNALRSTYDDRFRETVELIELSGPTVAREHFDMGTQKALTALLKETMSLATAQQFRMRSDLDQLTQAEAGSRTLVIVLSLGALLAGAALAWFMTRSIVRPVGEAVNVAEAIAQGNLSQAVPIGKGDEVGQLLRALKVMRDSIFNREEKILKLAYEDSLTGLPNRTRFLELFAALPSGGKGAIAVLNIDRFAMINNALGYTVGDRLLRAIGAKLSTPVVEPNVVVRLWGDQFAFLMVGADKDQALAVVDKIRRTLLDPIVLDGQRLDVGGSLGVVFYPQDGEDAPTLLRRAELATRRAKRRHSNLAFYEDVGGDPAHEQLSLIGEMREALERGEFIVHYQPKFSLLNNRMTSAEALLRWLHPTKGLIPPMRFIPFAEQTGFIRELTPWLLEHALGDAVAWRSKGLSVVPSVNLSAHDLLNPDLVGHIKQLLERRNLPPESLCLEITESALMDDPELALKHLNELSALGVKLSIDDYGSGQASLAYLKTLPVNELKIDRTFVTNISETPRNAAIVRSTIVLCHELGLTVVAEGAETREELAWLRQSGCDMVQGYVIAKPMPLDAFLEWRPPDWTRQQPVRPQ